MSIEELLAEPRTIAVVGLSSNRLRPSYGVSQYMQKAGFRIIPVNPAEAGPILGERVYPDLKSVPERIDIVDIFRRPEFVQEIVDDAIAVGAKAVWMQLDVTHEEAAAKARAAGLFVVMDRCILIEHQNLAR